MIFRKNKKVATEITAFLSVSKRYRTSHRKGTIVILDSGQDTFEFLSYLRDQCKLDLNLVLAHTPKQAETVIEDAEQIRAIIVQSSVFHGVGNIDTFLSWLTEEHHEVPVWVNACDATLEARIHSLFKSVCIIPSTKPRLSLIKSIGLPDICITAAARYS